MKHDTIQKLRAFDNQIFDAVQEYLNDRNDYAADVVLAINPKSHAISIDSPAACNGLEQYPIASLIRNDENGNTEPDCDATYELASNYYFVR